MRYFISKTGPEPALALGIIVLTPAGGTVAFTRPPLGRGAGKIGTAIRAIDLSAITTTTENHLAVAPSTIEESCTGVHGHTGPMRSGVWPVRVRSWTGCAKARFGAWRQVDSHILAGAVPVLLGATIHTDILIESHPAQGESDCARTMK
jgi:hypothetical protein